MMMKVRSIIKPIASLRLTVFCLGLGMILIFAATLDQVNLGIHAVEKKYFQSLFAFWQIPGAKFGGFHLGLPLPGGYLLGGVVLVNLACRFLGSVHIIGKPTQRIRQVTSGASEREVLPGVVIVGGMDAVAVCTWRDKGSGRIVVLGDPFGC